MRIDGWTLALQTVNLLVLLALLRWLFYRPLIGVIEARRKAVDDELAKAEAARREAEQRAGALSDARAALEGARRQLLDDARHDIDREREAAARRAQAAADATMADAAAQIDRERKAASQALFDEASALAAALATRLLAQVPGRADPGFVDALLERAQAASADETERWFGSGGAREVTLASAKALDDATRDGAMQRLRALFGDALQMSFTVDPALIAGAELRFAHGVLALHWAGEVAAARAQMQEAAKGPA